ncbi:MAG: hypothetical protein O3A51_00090 [Verrucomicrobia bacterium]|nr:hypothetical protein [Verrucomicrobiota bacterium]
MTKRDGHHIGNTNEERQRRTPRTSKCTVFERAALGLIVSTLVIPWGGAARAATAAERISELERKIDVLTREVEVNRYEGIFTEIGESAYGMGPAASKIYQADSGISIGGYGEALYENFEGDSTDAFDFLRMVLYVGHKFTDEWILNTELEFEHASTDKSGSASVEFAYLDRLIQPAFNLRAGLLLVPVGLINELHEPTVFLSARRPDVENRIIPTTWRENGVGAFGDLGNFSYKVYLVNGLRGEGFSASGLRGGRQKGSESLSDDFAGVVRVDWSPTEGVVVGGSYYAGDSGQDVGVALSTDIAEAHVDVRRHGFSFRALATVANVDDVASLNRKLATPDDGTATPADGEIDSVGEKMVGWYAELGFDVLAATADDERSLTPFVRYESYDTQDEIAAGFKRTGKTDVEVITVGVAAKPIDEIVFKADYQLYDNKANSATDQFNLAMGYVF